MSHVSQLNVQSKLTQANLSLTQIMVKWFPDVPIEHSPALTSEPRHETPLPSGGLAGGCNCRVLLDRGLLSLTQQAPSFPTPSACLSPHPGTSVSFRSPVAVGRTLLIRGVLRGKPPSTSQLVPSYSWCDEWNLPQAWAGCQWPARVREL